jgi:signal transduction histidine kinase
VVEDEPVIAAEIRHTLESLGYKVADVKAAGEDALDHLSREGADLVLMDIMLAGELDGVRTAELIGERHGVPVIFLSAYSDEETLSRVKPTVPYGYLVKPFSGAELRISIETALYKHMMEKRLQESERRLRHAQKMEAMGTMARGIAHDFNNILSAIIGYSEMCLLKTPEHDPMRKKLDHIYKAGIRAKNLVRLLLAFARQGQGEPKPVDPAPLIAEALSLVEPNFEPGTTVEQSIDSKAGELIGEPTQVFQVILNLMTNAVEAMRGQSGVMRVEVARDGADADKPMLRISVGDTGRGIKTADMERIFDPFFTTKSRGEGLGMGLAVVHGIVSGFGGSITVNSEPEAGTTFNVYLPAYVAEGNG